MTVLVPSLRDDAVGFDVVDAAVLQVHVGFGERTVEAVGERRPLAAEVVVRRQLAPQFLVPDRREAVHLRQVGRGDVEPAELPVVHAPRC